MKSKPPIVLSLLLAFASWAAAADALQIAVIPKTISNDYWLTVRDGALKAKADLATEGVAVEILWQGTEREDQIDTQKKLVADFVAKKVSAIVLAPMQSQALVSSVDAAVAASIPVVVIDSPLASDKAVSTVATNNYKAGMLAGRRVGDSLGGKGKVILLRFMKGHGSTQPRESGFLDAIKKYPGIQVVSSDHFSGATIEEATKSAKEILAQFGSDAQGIFASNLIATSGMLAALRETGQAGKVTFVGFDSSEAQVAAVRSGDMTGEVVQQPFMMGYLGVRTAVSVTQGKPVDKEVDTDTKLVTKDNLDTPEIQKLLNPGKK